MTNAPDHTDPVPAAADDERYVELVVEDGLIIYDRENHRAWLQSSATVPLEAQR